MGVHGDEQCQIGFWSHLVLALCDRVQASYLKLGWLVVLGLTAL